MSPENLLSRELDTWGEAGRRARFWWRDDDLGDPTSRLAPLLRVAASIGTEPLLAVVPSWATAELPKTLAGFPARVAVHGWAHLDHQGGNGKRAEFGDARPVEALGQDARAGRERLADLFGDDLIACFVPPWNRMVPSLTRTLPEAGYRAVSAFGSPPRASERQGVDWVNTHVDVINWRGDRRFIGVDAAADLITRELARRRCAKDREDEAIGLLTHHLEMTPDDWTGFHRLCDILLTHPAARVLSSSALFEKCGAHE